MFDNESDRSTIVGVRPVRDAAASLMPVDLRHQTFPKAFRGFEPLQVDAFLNQAADSYEQARRDVDYLRQELAQSRLLLTQHEARESMLRDTLLTAQRLAEQLKETAQEEARLILRDTEARAALILEKAQVRVDEMERQITELRLRRRDVEATLETAIATLQHGLDSVRGNAPSRDEQILVLRPRALESLPIQSDTGPADAVGDPAAAAAPEVGIILA